MVAASWERADADTMTTDEHSLTIRIGERRVSLQAGDRLTFGRDTPDASAHLGLSDNPRLHQLAGRIDVDDAGWVLTNTGRWLHLRVLEIDGPNRAELQPGRALRIPYPRCRVEITTGDETVGFEAASPTAHLHEPSGDAPPALSGSTVGGLGLDRQAGYFRALVALCAPRLRDPHNDDVSAVGEIVRMLNAARDRTERVTAKAVERRLAHVRRKVGLTAVDAYGGSVAGLEARDASRQLADLVVRTGTVTPADLALLEPAPEETGTP
jgi:hypothetical protein